MYFLAFFITLAFTFYIFYKVKQVRSNRPMEKKWLSAKASIALGLFVSLFGINQLVLFPGTVTYIVGALFILIGIGSTWAGFKLYKHVLPYAEREAKELNGN
ncbi:YtpI family protein [Rossellomorea aquimaris]|uniref:YtpI family protein n=1 Tax=Rossellomorea aquimaris TaxID=189382 RepID=UPI001CD7E0C4|nr:YtpI family protein [Rossellomorea aquimaris]MCA1056919.1 YtpI family protein [Rossellomorea aquimaris]